MSGEHKRPTQVDRVERALRELGQFNETAFAAPNVLDGGLPIQRVAARIFELRQRGLLIDTRRESNGTATYILRQSELVAVNDQGQTYLLEQGEAA
jgi:hypothetical protein